MTVFFATADSSFVTIVSSVIATASSLALTLSGLVPLGSAPLTPIPIGIQAILTGGIDGTLASKISDANFSAIALFVS